MIMPRQTFEGKQVVDFYAMHRVFFFHEVFEIYFKKRIQDKTVSVDAKTVPKTLLRPLLMPQVVVPLRSSDTITRSINNGLKSVFDTVLASTDTVLS